MTSPLPWHTRPAPATSLVLVHHRLPSPSSFASPHEATPCLMFRKGHAFCTRFAADADQSWPLARPAPKASSTPSASQGRPNCWPPGAGGTLSICSRRASWLPLKAVSSASRQRFRWRRRVRVERLKTTPSKPKATPHTPQGLRWAT